MTLLLTGIAWDVSLKCSFVHHRTCCLNSFLYDSALGWFLQSQLKPQGHQLYTWFFLPEKRAVVIFLGADIGKHSTDF